MTIPNNVPTSLRKPGAYNEFQFVNSSSLLTPLELRAVVIAECKGGTAAIEAPIQVFSEIDGDAKAGVGTLGALMLRAAFATASLKGATPEIWLCPIAEPGGGAQAQETITITVSPAQAGNLVFLIAGRLVTVGVSAGDTPTTIAVAIVAAIASLATTLPIVATNAAGVVTCKFITKGVNGNDCTYSLVSGPVGVTVVFAQSVAGTGVAVITNALAALYDKRYHATAISNHTTVDIATLFTDRAFAWSFVNQNYRFHFVGDCGTLSDAQTLQAAANDLGIVVVSAEQCPALPGELAICTAVAEFARAAPNANLAGDVLPLPQPPASFVYTDAEIESALNGGVTPLVTAGSFMSIVRLVTTAISVNSAPFEPTRDLAYPRTAAYLAEEVADAWLIAFQQANETDDVLEAARNLVVEVQRDAESAGYIKNVDDHLGEIQAIYVTPPNGRMVAVNPFEVAGPLYQGVFENIMYM